MRFIIKVFITGNYSNFNTFDINIRSIHLLNIYPMYDLPTELSKIKFFRIDVSIKFIKKIEITVFDSSTRIIIDLLIDAFFGDYSL